MLSVRELSGIIQTGDTLLGSVRCWDFENHQAQKRTIERLRFDRLACRHLAEMAPNRIIDVFTTRVSHH